LGISGNSVSGAVVPPLSTQQTVYIHLKDKVGNISAAQASKDVHTSAVTTDITAPTAMVGITPGAIANDYIGDAQVSITDVTETGAGGVEYTITNSQALPSGGWTSSVPTAIKGFFADGDDVKTVYVHLRDGLGNAQYYEKVLRVGGTPLFLDTTVPTLVVSVIKSDIINNTGFGTVVYAKLKLSATDGGSDVSAYAVSLAGAAGPSTTDDTGWTPYGSNIEITYELNDGDIKTITVYTKDKVGNIASPNEETLSTSPLYVDRVGPAVTGGTLSTTDGSAGTGSISGISIVDENGGNGENAAFVSDFDFVPANYTLSLEVGNQPSGSTDWTVDESAVLALTTGYNLAIAPSELPETSSTKEYRIKLVPKDKGGVSREWTRVFTIEEASTVYSYAESTISWSTGGTNTLPSPPLSFSMASFGFSSPLAASPAVTSAPPVVYGSGGGVRYPLAGLTRTQARRSGGGAWQFDPEVSYSSRNEDPGYLHSYGVSPKNARESYRPPVSVTVVSEQPTSRRERPGRAQGIPQNSGLADPAPYTGDPVNLAAETPEFGDLGAFLGASPADSPAPVEAPRNNHRVPFRNSDFSPFILPQGGGPGSPAKGRRGPEDDEEADSMV
jgi:hypothetical protein